ncbi:oxygen-independent coproporphyrinogen III oxidase [Caulobacter sp.]|uniref:oxygen-independent coproporphyrinogen III oxidase n=1 Tax=Caulobacter sp. TaxID=78 RepID=UPI0031D265F3
MTFTALSDAQRAHAGRNLPRYTSYPTALAFDPEQGRAAEDWFAGTRAEDRLSVYVHVPFCRRLCWYCGCNTSIVHTYDRVGAYIDVLTREVDLVAQKLGTHDGLAHLHFGGGSPNALRPHDFLALVQQLTRNFGLRAGAEVAAELDPGLLSDAFIDAAGEAGVTRVSLGVQTFDPHVQEMVNRIQPLDMVARAVERLRGAGVGGMNFDLMYGLPGQTPENVHESARLAAQMRPDRVAVFGYAHVPWMKKHQIMIREADLADLDGRWAQAEAADAALTEAGYVRIGLDHYALAEDPLTQAMAEGRLRRNFQGYTDDPAPVLIPIGPSSIGQFREGFVQNHTPTDDWAARVVEGHLPLNRALPVSDEDRLRAAVIERLMCDMAVDLEAVCRAQNASVDQLAGDFEQLDLLARDGLCARDGAVVTIPESGRRLMRVVAAVFDARLPKTVTRHAKAV